jgi:hypothetical protein
MTSSLLGPTRTTIVETRFPPHPAERAKAVHPFPFLASVASCISPSALFLLPRPRSFRREGHRQLGRTTDFFPRLIGRVVALKREGNTTGSCPAPPRPSRILGSFCCLSSCLRNGKDHQLELWSGTVPQQHDSRLIVRVHSPSKVIEERTEPCRMT